MRINCLAGEINKAFDYIERNLTEKVSLDDLAAACGLSKYHLHRILSAIANRPIMDYVRARKLSAGIDKLKNNRYRVIDIAAEYSFNYEQSYIRAFKKEFGVAPGAFRVRPYPLYTTEKICPLLYSSVSEGLLISPVFQIKPGFVLAGREIILDPLRNRWDSMNQDRISIPFSELQQQLAGVPHANRFFGLTCWKGVQMQNSIYYPCMEAVSADAVPQGFSVHTLSTCQYAVFKYIGLFHAQDLTQSHLDELWEYIHYAWMPKSRYQLSHSYHFIYMDYGTIWNNYCEAELYVPVVERHPAGI